MPVSRPRSLWPTSHAVGGAAACARTWGGVLVACAVLLMAGCASGPNHTAGGYKRPPRVGASVPASPPGVPPVVERPGPAVAAERDGLPPASEAPSLAQLAALPDPVPQVEPIREGGPNKPYEVLGQSYEPLKADEPLKQRGVASWYGRKFHGRRTASGELYNMYGLTAAHRTLPIPSYARVTDLLTGKSIIVRVNDRGPFHSARVLDLSYAAAVKLGIAGRGSAEVDVERLTFEDIRTGAWRQGGDEVAATALPLSPLPPAPVLGSLPADPADVSRGIPADATSAGVVTAGVPVVLPVAVAAPQAAASLAAPAPVARAFTPFQRGFWVQLAALSKRDGVERLQQRIANELAALQPLLAVFQEAAIFKVQVGPYATRAEALAAADQAKASLSVSPMVIERR